MICQVASDLHWEFQLDHGLAQTAELGKSNADVLILAGDICPAKYVDQYLDSFHRLSERYGRVLMVPGNHEFYGTNLQEGYEQLETIEEHFPNITLLDRHKVVEIAGVRFAGCVLWFPEATDGKNNRYKKYMSDFKLIRNPIEAMYEENNLDRCFLAANPDVDVVMTHHIPMDACIQKRWQGHFLNRFFVGGAETALYNSNARYLIWGHTHDSTYEKYSEQLTFICNPFGYARTEENPNFKWDLTFELESS